MSIPAEPPSPPRPPSGPSPSSQASPAPFPGSSSTPPPSKSLEDPTGMWQKWLSKSGVPATPEDVHIFFQNLLKFLNVAIQQNAAAAQRAYQHEKDVIEGRE